MNDETFLNLKDKDYNFDNLIGKNQLKSLALNFYDIDENILSVINQLDNLETITLNFCTVKSDNIKLKNHFKQIILSYTNIDLKIFNMKEDLLELEILNDEDDNIEVDIRDVLEFKNIEVLRIYNSKIKNSADINKLENLKKLFLDGSLVDTKNFSEILNKQLEFIYKRKYLFD